MKSENLRIADNQQGRLGLKTQNPQRLHAKHLIDEDIV